MTLKQTFPEVAAPERIDFSEPVWRIDYSKPVHEQERAYIAHEAEWRARVLENAATYIELNGWRRGSLGHYDTPGMPVCAVGAIGAVLGHPAGNLQVESDLYTKANDIYNYRAADLKSHDIVFRNDQSHNSRQITDMLRRRAEDLRAVTHAF